MGVAVLPGEFDVKYPNIPHTDVHQKFGHRIGHLCRHNPTMWLVKHERKLFFCGWLIVFGPGRVAQSVGHLTRKSGVLGSIPGLATYFCFSFRFFKKGSCQLLAKVCARSTG